MAAGAMGRSSGGARRPISDQYVAHGLSELAGMVRDEGGVVPRWLLDGERMDRDGSWLGWWDEHLRRLSGKEPYHPNGILVQAAQSWARHSGVTLG